MQPDDIGAPARPQWHCAGCGLPATPPDPLPEGPTLFVCGWCFPYLQEQPRLLILMEMAAARGTNLRESAEHLGFRPGRVH